MAITATGMVCGKRLRKTTLLFVTIFIDGRPCPSAGQLDPGEVEILKTGEYIQPTQTGTRAGRICI